MKFEFNENSSFPITLEGLSRSIVEKYPSGEAVGGIAHHILISEILSLIQEKGFSPIITDIFCANNRDKYRPGVTIDKERAAQMEELDYEALIMRRIFVNIDLVDLSDGGIDTRCVISYSQRGITIAFGLEVKACRNLSILRPKDVFTTYSIGRKSVESNIERDVNVLIGNVANYLDDFSSAVSGMYDIHYKWRSTPFGIDDYAHLLYELMNARVRHDSQDKSLSTSEIYPLNSSQINSTFEKSLLILSQRVNHEVDLNYWNALNMFNTVFKPDQMALPNIIPQSLALSDSLARTYDYMLKNNG